jgi:hypothetical protein
MAVPDFPSQLQERVVCSIFAAVKYEVPANIMLAIAEQEGGHPGQWKRNDNGTNGVGPMQFNTAYLRELIGMASQLTTSSAPDAQTDKTRQRKTCLLTVPPVNKRSVAIVGLGYCSLRSPGKSDSVSM